MDKDIWLLKADCNKDLVIRTELDYFNTHFIGTKLTNNWEPPAIRIEGKSKRLRDFVSWMIQVPVVSEKAKMALEPLISPYAEFLPLIELKEKQYYAINVVHLVDCLDKKRSKISYSNSNPDKILAIYLTYFDENRLDGSPIFKIPDWPNDVFVNRSFVDVVIANNLRGAVFANPGVNPFKSILEGKSANVIEGVPE